MQGWQAKTPIIGGGVVGISIPTALAVPIMLIGIGMFSAIYYVSTAQVAVVSSFAFGSVSWIICLAMRKRDRFFSDIAVGWVSEKTLMMQQAVHYREKWRCPM